MKHHPSLYFTGRHGCWATCDCGWKSGLFHTVTGAHLEFGRHLAEHGGDVPYEAIPESARLILDEVYTREGVVIWWNARHQLLGGRRARDVWHTDPELVDQVLDTLTGQVAT